MILGMGAFAIENMRTAFERGAAHVTLLCRRRGTICPQLVDWINFIRPWKVRDHLPRHDAVGDAQVLQAWRAAYDVSGAVRPECWQQARLDAESVWVQTVGCTRSHKLWIPHAMQVPFVCRCAMHIWFINRVCSSLTATPYRSPTSSSSRTTSA